MILLQAAIGGAIALLTLIGIAFLIGMPVLTILISNYLSAKDERTGLNDSKNSSFSKDKKPKSNNLLMGCLASFAIILILIFLGILVLTKLFPNID